MNLEQQLRDSIRLHELEQAAKQAHMRRAILGAIQIGSNDHGAAEIGVGAIMRVDRELGRPQMSRREVEAAVQEAEVLAALIRTGEVKVQARCAS